MWGRWMNATIQGQRQFNSMSQWWERGLDAFQRMGSFYSQFFGLSAAQQPATSLFSGWPQALMPLFELQQRSLQWLGMVPPHVFQELSKKVAALEEQVRSQAYLIERLQGRLNQGEQPGASEMSNQFKTLIDQQSKQFQQLTTSIGQFFQERAKSSSTKD